MKSTRASRQWHFSKIVIATCLLAGCALGQQGATGHQPGEYDVKAVFLLNFVKFVEWPGAEADDSSTFSICLLGGDPFGGALDRVVQGESFNGRRIIVERVRRWQRSCRVLFVSAAEPDVSGTLAAAGPGVLTVGEDDRFLRAGGMIGFVLEDRRVRFDVNQKAVRAGSLRISSRMLGVARQVLP